MNLMLKPNQEMSDMIEIYASKKSLVSPIAVFHRDFLRDGNKEALELIEKNGFVDVKLIIKD